MPLILVARRRFELPSTAADMDPVLVLQYLDKISASAGLEPLFIMHCFFFRREIFCEDNFPWPILRCPAFAKNIVRFQPRLDVGCEPNIMSVVFFGKEDINSEHHKIKRHLRSAFNFSSEEEI